MTVGPGAGTGRSYYYCGLPGRRPPRAERLHPGPGPGRGGPGTARLPLPGGLPPVPGRRTALARSVRSGRAAH